MDDKSTPISALNNKGDESETVNQILSKYNNLQDGQTSIPPLNREITEMENKFENRNFNQEVFDLNSKNVAYSNHYEKEVERSKQYQNSSNVQVQDTNEEEYEDEYEEYEVIELPLWKKILNEVRIPIFIFLFILILNNCTFDKLLIGKIPFLGNQFNECNTYGFLLKSFLIALLSYLLIRFVRF